MTASRLRLTIDDRVAVPASPASTPRLELAVMETVVNALTRLPDQRARERVARWAISVLDAGGPVSGSSVDVEGVQEHEEFEEPSDDLEVSARDLEQLFEKPAVPQVFTPRVRSRRRSVVTARIQGFLADVQKLARDWTAIY